MKNKCPFCGKTMIDGMCHCEKHKKAFQALQLAYGDLSCDSFITTIKDFGTNKTMLRLTRIESANQKRTVNILHKWSIKDYVKELKIVKL